MNGISVLRWLSNRVKVNFSKNGFVTGKRKELVFQVLAFHRVGPDSDGVFDPIPPDIFESCVEYLAKNYSVFTAGDLWRRSVRGDMPDNALAITFDDGYRDNYEFAFPILKKYNLPATIFLTTGPIDGKGPLWHDRMFAAFALTKTEKWEFKGQIYYLNKIDNKVLAVEMFADYVRLQNEEDRDYAIGRLCSELGVNPTEAEKRSPMLTWGQVREMAGQGIEIGAHTISHPILSRLDSVRQFEEIEGAIRRIEEAVGTRPSVFAYPNGRPGDFNDQTIDALVRSKIDAAFTTISGCNSKQTNPYRLHRGGAWSHNLPRFAFQLAWNRLKG